MVVNKREALYLNYFKRLSYTFAYIPPLSISLHSFQQSLHQQTGVDLAARKAHKSSAHPWQCKSKPTSPSSCRTNRQGHRGKKLKKIHNI